METRDQPMAQTYQHDSPQRNLPIKYYVVDDRYLNKRLLSTASRSKVRTCLLQFLWTFVKLFCEFCENFVKPLVNLFCRCFSKLLPVSWLAMLPLVCLLLFCQSFTPICHRFAILPLFCLLVSSSLLMFCCFCGRPNFVVQMFGVRISFPKRCRVKRTKITCKIPITCSLDRRSRQRSLQGKLFPPIQSSKVYLYTFVETFVKLFHFGETFC